MEELVVDDFLHGEPLFEVVGEHLLEELLEVLVEEAHLVEVLEVLFALNEHDLLLYSVPEPSEVFLGEHAVEVVGGHALALEGVDLVGDGEHGEAEGIDVGLLEVDLSVPLFEGLLADLFDEFPDFGGEVFEVVVPVVLDCELNDLLLSEAGADFVSVAEVRDLVALFGAFGEGEDVLGFEVAMDHVFGVTVVDALAHLQENVLDFLHVQVLVGFVELEQDRVGLRHFDEAALFLVENGVLLERVLLYSNYVAVVELREQLVLFFEVRNLVGVVSRYELQHYWPHLVKVNFRVAPFRAELVVVRVQVELFLRSS